MEFAANFFCLVFLKEGNIIIVGDWVCLKSVDTFWCIPTIWHWEEVVFWGSGALCLLIPSLRQSRDGRMSFFVNDLNILSLKSRRGLLFPSYRVSSRPMQRAQRVLL